MSKEVELNWYYVSLTRDLLGYYLVFEADSEQAVRQYIKQEYWNEKKQIYTLPWCAVYTQKQVMRNSADGTRYLVKEIHPSCGVLYETN